MNRRKSWSDLSNGIRELYPDSYEHKRLEMEKKEEICSKTIEKRRLKKWKNLIEVIQHLVKKLRKQNLTKPKK